MHVISLHIYHTVTRFVPKSISPLLNRGESKLCVCVWRGEGGREGKGRENEEREINIKELTHVF